jgi:hypothetical protein
MNEGMAELRDSQIRELLKSYLQQILQQYQRDRVLGTKNWKGEEDQDEHVDAMTYLQHECQRELAIGNYSRATGAVGLLLAKQRIELDPDGSTYEKLCREMMKVMINHLEIEIRRTRFNYSLDDLPFPELGPGGQRA